MITLYSQEENCCGCTACATVCPKAAITMVPDVKGFLYPKIDDNKCIQCGLCQKVCAFQKGYSLEENFDPPQLYGVQHLDEQERATSRSGGMFAALCRWFFQEKQGVVYGAGYGEHFCVVHKRVENIQEALELKGSKYVQSDLGTVYDQIRQDLKAGKNVLFSGTPCQTAGLRSALSSENTQHLYICDLVCHGVPSPKIWEDYLIMQERRNHAKAIQVNFRDKSIGWRPHVESIVFETGVKQFDNIYACLFNKSIML